jgi:acetolactate synthase-1/2/3 large subunit
MKIRAADYIASLLYESGYEDLFMLTGGGAMFLNDGLGHSKLKCHFMLHEQALTMAAEGYARLRRKPAAVCVTTGPGGTNAITGVLGAYQDSIPMLVISGQVKQITTVDYYNLDLRQLGDQEYFIIRSVSPMTKYAVTITDPDTVKYHVLKAIHLADSGRKGPCWIDVPIDIQSAVIDTEKQKDYDPEEYDRQLPPPPQVEDVKKIASLIKKAKRPLIYAGAGIRKAGCEEIYLKLLEKLNIPSVTAWCAIDLLENDHPLYAGRPGMMGERAGNFAVQNADLLLVIASRLNIRQVSYEWKNFAKNAYKIMVDIDKGELYKPTLSIDMPIWADAAQFMEMLYCFCERADCGEWIKYCRENVERYKLVTDKHFLKKDIVNPYVFMDKFSKMLPSDADIIASNGSCCVIGSQAINIKKGMRFFENDGCASMGYGLPAAIGACISKKGKEVYCLEGDGSIQMNIQELQTVVTYNLPVKIVLINNEGYHSIRQSQSNYFKGFVGIGPQSGDLSFPDMGKIAFAYGIPYIRINNNAEIEEKIKILMNHNGFMMCEVMCDKEQFFEPKLVSKKLEDGTFVSHDLSDMYPFLPREEYEERMKISKN